MRWPVLLALVTALSAGCGGSDGDGGSSDADRSAGAPAVEDPGAVHVHGLGVNPKDGALFVATHTGLFRAPAGRRTAERVANRHQDTMGFTVVGPDRFLGSGHPDLREGLPPFLGLIRSTDAGRSWQAISLMGRADFHVLEASGKRVYGFGSDYQTRAPTFLTSDDGGRSWTKRPTPGGLVSLAISPDDPEHVVAATEGGLYSSRDAGAGWRPLARDVGLLSWASSGSVFLVDADGGVRESRDDGRSWREVGDIGGQPAAFEAAGKDLYAALHDGTIKQSGNSGRTWTVRSRPQAAASR